MKSGFPICNRNAIYFSFRFLFCFPFYLFFFGGGGGGGEYDCTVLRDQQENTRTVLQMFFSDYALIVKSEIRIANPNPDFLCMRWTCSARAI